MDSSDLYQRTHDQNVTFACSWFFHGLHYPCAFPALWALFVSFTCDTLTEYTLASFQCTLKFITKELDPTSGEPEEEGYPVR